MRPRMLVVLAIPVCLIAGGIFLWRVTVGRPMHYEIPGGFKGWIVVKYEDSAWPPLARRAMHLVVTVPTSGKVCTSTSHPEGWIYSRFEYVYPNGAREALALRPGSGRPGEVLVSLVTYMSDYKWEENFVGTKEETAHWGAPPDPWR